MKIKTSELIGAVDLTDTVCKALRHSWHLGQTYWQQADSESFAQNKKAETTHAAFVALLDDTRAALAVVDALNAAQPAPQQPGVGISGFDHKTAADFLNGKTVSDEAMRKFVAASRWAHDDRAGLQAMLLTVRHELASREAEIALLKTALMNAEAAAKQGGAA